MIRNIYILLLLAFSFGTIYGASFTNSGTVTINNSNAVQWYENDGFNNFTTHIIDNSTSYAILLASAFGWIYTRLLPS